MIKQIQDIIRIAKNRLGFKTYFVPVSEYLDAAVPEEYTNAAKRRRGFTMVHQPTQYPNSWYNECKYGCCD